jgi:flagellar basal body-associated protein FliL
MDDVTAPKKVNIPLIVLIIVAIVAAVIIFVMRSSPDVPPATEGPVPNPPAVTDPELTKPKSPEQSPAPGASSDSSGVPGLPPSTQ